MTFKAEVALFVVVFALFFLGPLTVFSGQLARVKRMGLREYGMLASHYVQEFDERWVQESAPGTEELLGSGDIQSLTDLEDRIVTVREMRPVPFGMNAVIVLVAASVAPLVPLTRTVSSAEAVLLKVIQILL